MKFKFFKSFFWGMLLTLISASNLAAQAEPTRLKMEITLQNGVETHSINAVVLVQEGNIVEVVTDEILIGVIEIVTEEILIGIVEVVTDDVLLGIVELIMEFENQFGFEHIKVRVSS